MKKRGRRYSLFLRESLRQVSEHTGYVVAHIVDNKRKITLITPHQLSTEAKMLIRQGNEESFVRDIANKGYYDSCKTIDQEVDLEIYIHIIRCDNKSWLTIQRGKHRLIQQTKEEYKYCVLPFDDIGDIRDDVHGPDTSRQKPGGPAPGQKPAFWDFDVV